MERTLAGFSTADSPSTAGDALRLVSLQLGADILDYPLVADVVNGLAHKRTSDRTLLNILDGHLTDVSELAPTIISVSRHEHDLGDFVILELLYPGYVGETVNALMPREDRLHQQVFGRLNAFSVCRTGWPANLVTAISGAGLLAGSWPTPISRAIH